jgi:hypothetical protein
MYIDVENLHDVISRHPELETVRKITANHGEESEISQLCELIAKLYAKIDSLFPPKVTVETPADENPVSSKTVSSKSR